MPGLDVAIVGAGPVGATVAALAATAGLRVAVFEARAAPSSDARTLALSYASRELLEEVGAWPAAAATPITSIHVSQRGGPGRALLEAGDARLPALGYTISYAVLEAALAARLGAAGVPIDRGAACERIELDASKATIHLSSGATATARLLVLADGGANVARIPGLAFEEKDYQQHALVASLECDRPHGGRAYERFTPRGPMALLPVENRYALVWTAGPHEVADLLALDDAAFLSRLQEAFGDRAGRFTAVGKRNSFPLRLKRLNTPIALRTVVVGNAAQSLHPIAGQGLNLGLRDAAALVALLRGAAPEHLGSIAMLREYRESRERDASRGVAFTDALVSIFSDARLVPTWGRGLAIAALDLLPPARRLLARRMIHGSPAA